MAIIGTAGHIDHGKSALVQALTSINPDRLPEEIRREMTIDLGFAWLPLSSGDMVGIVDVPGHEDFVRNMIAGVGEIDAAILVIAQDEGWMPQTEEHLRILDFLGIKHGIIALTKIDLSDDSRWLDLVEEEVRERTKGTTLSDVPIVRVSARLGTNIQELRQKIEELISNIPPSRDIGKPCLAIDRVFSIRGSGVVVTGTLTDGTLARGDEVYIFPKNLTARIRALESYKEKLDRAKPGTRVAINLAGLEKEDLNRGDIIFGNREQVKSSRIIDVKLQLIPQLSSPLKSNTEYKIYLGTKEVSGKILLLGQEVLEAGDSAFAQFRFQEAVATRLGERFIVRRVSPSETVGGGTVLDPLASRHKFRDTAKIIRFLERRERLEIGEVVLSELERSKHVEEKDFLVASYYSASEIGRLVESLRAKSEIIRAGSWIVDVDHWQMIYKQALDIMAKEHARNPLKKGLSHAEFESRLHLPRSLFNQLMNIMIESGEIARTEGAIFLTTHAPSLTPAQETLVSRILRLFRANQTNPPTHRDVVASMPDSELIIRYMCQQNLLVELQEGVLFERNQFEGIKNRVIDYLRKNNSINIQQMRHLFGFSRKYILPLLNRLEEEGVLRRHGQERVLAKKQDISG